MYKKQNHIGLIIAATFNALLLFILFIAIINLGWLMLTDHKGDPVPATKWGSSYGLVKYGWENDSQDDLNSIAFVGWLLVPYVIFSAYFYKRYLKEHSTGKARFLIKAVVVADILAFLCFLLVDFIVEPYHWR